MNSALVTFICISLYEFEFVVRVIKFNQLENFRKSIKRNYSSLFAHDGENSSEIETLFGHMALNFAEEILIILKIVR